MPWEFLFKRKKEKELSGSFLKKIEEDMVRITGGSFLMGSNDGEDDERPIHNVMVDDFLLGKYEITQHQWFELMGTRPWADMKYIIDNGNCPVGNVNWYETREFIRKLNKLSQHKFRLPTEAEWEYACKADSTTRFFHSSLKLNLTQYAWFYDNAFKKGSMHAREVGTREPNPWGLYDMLGNVYEWCSDWYSRNFYNKSPVQNPSGPNYGSYKVVRGGDWARTDYFLRVASRRYYSPHYKDVNVSFRLAESVAQNEPS